jgi:predicted nucleic acid-binding Zn ribbon protein
MEKNHGNHFRRSQSVPDSIARVSRRITHHLRKRLFCGASATENSNTHLEKEQMSIEEKTNRTFTAAMFVIGAIVLMLCATLVMHTVAANRARSALAAQMSSEYASFTRGEGVNVSKASCGWVTVVRADYNKSKIVGEWAGSRAKEVVSGFASGLTKKSKHSD